MPGKPPNDYSYMMAAMKSANVTASLRRDGLVDIRGVWFHEVAAGDFFVVVSLKQRYPGHARQAAYMTAQCRAGGTALGRYVVVVDDDIDPKDLNQVVWAIGTRSNPERDIDLLRNTYSSPVDPMQFGQAGIVFGSRAIIDATKPFDRIAQFPMVAESSAEQRERVRAKWKDAFGW
jgi:UbiD family decarboxylase